MRRLTYEEDKIRSLGPDAVEPKQIKYKKFARKFDKVNGELARLFWPICAEFSASGRWHWLKYHFQTLPPRGFGRELLECAADIEQRMPGVGQALLRELFHIGGAERSEEHYNQILQKLSELLAVRQIGRVQWRQPVRFELEGRPANSQRRVDLVVAGEEYKFGFEVKAPAYIAYNRRRNQNDFQALARLLPRPQVDRVMAGTFTYPRDNPVKDFLTSANEKFRAFKEREPQFIGFLIIVWDDFINEIVSALKHPQSGLLTENSFAKDSLGNSIEFQNVDGVIVVRHLAYFVEAMAGRSLPDRVDGFDFGDKSALPNIFFPITPIEELPDELWLEFRALPWDHDSLSRMAEYVPGDFVIWV